MAREISLARHTWDLLKPLEPSADTINVERHLPTQFQLAPPKETGMIFHSGYRNFLGAGRHHSQEVELSSPSPRPALLQLESGEQSRSMSQALPSANSAAYSHSLDTPVTELSPSGHVASLASIDGARFDLQNLPDPQRVSSSAVEPPFSPESLSSFVLSQPRIEPINSSIYFKPAPFVRSRTVPVVSIPEKGKSSWRSKIGSRKDSTKASGGCSGISYLLLDRWGP